VQRDGVNHHEKGPVEGPFWLVIVVVIFDFADLVLVLGELFFELLHVLDGIEKQAKQKE
jgi:hypothetical protein